MGGSAVTGCRSQPSALPGSGQKTRDCQSPPQGCGMRQHGGTMKEGAERLRQRRHCPVSPSPAPARPHGRHSTPGTICYVSARGPSATASPLRNPVNDPWIRAGKIHCPCSPLPRAKTRTQPPRRLGR